nr:hypothetical protein GCM10017745_55550 [Saccharothrix mutabilis subsp. capreolus]
MERRTFLRAAVAGGGSMAFGFTLWSEALAYPAQTGPSPYGALQAADANGIQLPQGFTSRVIARSTQTVPGTGYVWHSAPDGGACYADGTGWIYVSNAEMAAPAGGAGAVRFSSTGQITGRTASSPAPTATARAATRRGARGCRARRWTSGTSTRQTRSA